MQDRKGRRPYAQDQKRQVMSDRRTRRNRTRSDARRRAIREERR